jgi:diguanylate cyclase (GGDEF)-like protein/PAS domain S-box-containing protein
MMARYAGGFEAASLVSVDADPHCTRPAASSGAAPPAAIVARACGVCAASTSGDVQPLGHLGDRWYGFCDARTEERLLLIARTAGGPPAADRALLAAETVFDAIAHRREVARHAARSSRLEAMLRTIEQMAEIGIWQVNLPTGAVSWSEEAFRIHGLEPGTPEPSFEETIAFYPEEVRGLARQNIEAAVAERSRFSFVLPFRRADGEVRTVRCIGEALSDSGLDDIMCGILQDVTEEREAQLRLWWSANHDALTGLPNRTLWQERLDQALANAHGHGHAVGLILADLDSFKSINDIYGHEAGDEVLKSVAARLAAQTRQGDTLARLGGDEFAIIVNDLTAPEDLDRPLRRLLEAAEVNVTYRGTEIPVKLSMGAAVFPRDARHERELYRNADLALFRSKADPERRGTLYSARYGEEQEGRETRANKIRAAIYQQSIVPCYQPVMRLDDGTATSLEALARWQDGERLFEVSAFPSAFEDPELAPLLGVGLVDRIGEDWVAMRKTVGHVVPLCINASPRQLQNLPFVEALERLIDDAILAPEQLVLEVKQDPLPPPGNPVRPAVVRLIERGVLVSFDSLVVGFSALVERSPIRITQIKMHRRAVGDAGPEGRVQPAVTGIMEACRRHGIELVACGIESAADLASVRAMGFRYGQGFYLREPAPIETVLNDLSCRSGYALPAS